MARETLIPQAVISSGTEVVFTDAVADGHKFTNTDHTLLIIKNASGGEAPNYLTVTINTPGTVDGLAIAEREVEVQPEEIWVWRGAPSVYNQPSGADADKVYIDYSDVTSIQVAAVVV